MKTDSALAKIDGISTLIQTIRGQRVIFDSDLACIYGVTTKALNQAVKRNQKRFPKEFVFHLEGQDFTSLRSQIVTLKNGRGRHRKYQPYAFTEHGALMAATVLNSTRAVAMNPAPTRKIGFHNALKSRAANISSNQ